MTGPGTGGVRDRRVLGLLALLVLLLLGANLLSALVPGMDEFLAGAPVLVAVLVGGTVLVLARALTRGRHRP